MDSENFILITKGAIKHLPGVKKILPSLKTGGTIESRYCYSVWLRHLKYWIRFRDGIPETVAELGPGDSLGTGLASLLSGTKHYYALDIIKYWDNCRNLEIFEELTELFKNKTKLPDDNEYPKVKPKPDNYNFPSDILTDEVLNTSLLPERLDRIRKEIMDINNPENHFIKTYIPWQDSHIIKNNSVDFIYSQAVLECIEDLDNTYNTMNKWLKPGGLMSHTIDFKCHGLTKEWNGHWKFSDLEWFLVKGGRSFVVNRQPLSKHLEMHSKYGFEILIMTAVKNENRLDINKLPKKFRNLSEEDMTTSGAYIMSSKKC